MATRTELSLPEARVEAVEQDGERIRIRFQQYFLFEGLTGSDQETQWRQAGSLVFEQAEIVSGAPAVGVLRGGDLQDNAYLYRDRVPLPLDSRGQVGCSLRFEHAAAPLEIRGARVRLEPEGERRYLGHVT